jgi:hypothetical protein
MLPIATNFGLGFQPSFISFMDCHLNQTNTKARFEMKALFSAISGFIQTAITATLIGSGLLLLAGEIRLAALRKASQGSSKLSGFTQKMTKTSLNKILRD